MSDPYLYRGTDVLRNKLYIRNPDGLRKAETDLSVLRIADIYASGFRDFTSDGMFSLHRRIFGDIYPWAGKPRTIDIQKRERVLDGMSLRYSDHSSIRQDLTTAFGAINGHDWDTYDKDQFVDALVETFPTIWRVHPFREGNTRTTVVMMAEFSRAHGFEFDADLLRRYSPYVRDALILASLRKGEGPEPEHLKKILRDAVNVPGHHENQTVRTVDDMPDIPENPGPDNQYGL